MERKLSSFSCSTAPANWRFSSPGPMSLRDGTTWVPAVWPAGVVAPMAVATAALKLLYAVCSMIENGSEADEGGRARETCREGGE